MKKKQVHLKNHRMAMKLIISQSDNKKKNRKKTKRKYDKKRNHDLKPKMIELKYIFLSIIFCHLFTKES